MVTTRNLRFVSGMSLALLSLLVMPGALWGQIPWASDFQAASEAARAERKLVLLHFFSDDCPPCVRVERNVFSQPEVAQAIARNYVPVKVHVKQSPQLANRYQVRSWPTDIFVNPAGQEIFRTTSPQAVADYISLVDQIALQAGIGAGRTVQAQALMNVPASMGAAPQTEGAIAPQQAAVPGLPPGDLRSAYQPAFAGYGPPGQQPASQGYQPVQSYLPVQPPIPEQVPLGTVAPGGYAAAPAPSGAAPMPNAAPAPYGAAPTTYGAAPPPVAASAYSQQPAPQELMNRYVPQPSPVDLATPNLPVAPPQYPPPGMAAAPSVPPTAAPVAPPQTPAPPTSNVAVASASNVSVASQTPVTLFVPAAQAPAMAMDGFCPVTLLEQTAWKKGDPQFGVVHGGRTYLFASAVEQKKFLGDPDRFSPVLSGYDPVRYVTNNGELTEGKRSFGLTYRNQLFLFADEASRVRFEQSPAAFTTAAYQAMLRKETGATYR